MARTWLISFAVIALGSVACADDRAPDVAPT